MRLTKRPMSSYIRYTLTAARGEQQLDDSVIESRRWLDKRRSDTRESRTNFANCLRSMRAHLRTRLNMDGQNG